jgi:hypothetical protein
MSPLLFKQIDQELEEVGRQKGFYLSEKLFSGAYKLADFLSTAQHVKSPPDSFEASHTSIVEPAAATAPSKHTLAKFAKVSHPPAPPSTPPALSEPLAELLPLLAASLGSRDYTLKGTLYLDERIFECRVRAMGTEAEPIRIKIKTKRRNQKIKTVKSKHKFTILRIAELKINDVGNIKLWLEEMC